MGRRVLIVEDEDDVATLIAAVLESEGFETKRLPGGDGVLGVIRDWQPSVMVLDVMMPGRSGHEVCEEVRATPAGQRLGIIMLSAMSDPSERVIGLERGADDYVGKPFSPAELIARVQSVVRRGEALSGMSPLSGLPGNVEIAHQLSDEIERDPQRFALVHADLDHFKAFNDRYGFLRGDQAIRATAALLTEVTSQAIGQPAFVGHVGGDDFALLLPADEAIDLCQVITRRFDAMAPTLYDDADRESGSITVPDRRGEAHAFPLLSISLGVATSDHRRVDTVAEAAHIAGEMKTFAKRSAGSSWSADRRTST